MYIFVSIFHFLEDCERYGGTISASAHATSTLPPPVRTEGKDGQNEQKDVEKKNQKRNFQKKQMRDKNSNVKNDTVYN